MNFFCEKLIFRHPHIYGDVKVSNEEEEKQNWEKIKLKEGKTSVLGGVPKSLPSMVKAMRLQEKSKQVGFEWDTTDQVWNKVEEELAELKEAVEMGVKAHMEDELGDVFFSLVNYARFLQIDAEYALEKTNKKFKQRFQAMECYANDHGLDLSKMTLAEKDDLWKQMKTAE